MFQSGAGKASRLVGQSGVSPELALTKMDDDAAYQSGNGRWRFQDAVVDGRRREGCGGMGGRPVGANRPMSWACKRAGKP